VEQIALVHVFEHLYVWEGREAIKRWYEILQPGGRLVIEVPCINKILDLFAKGERDPSLTYYGLYGEQTFGEKEMNHKWCYSYNQLKSVFREAGFKKENIIVTDPVYHKVIRDMRVVGIK
jgi:predicted SAM-dependent methyltransferase